MTAKKHTLKDIVDDYIKHMHGINEKRMEYLQQELEYVQEEFKLFSLLQHNVHLLESA